MRAKTITQVAKSQSASDPERLRSSGSRRRTLADLGELILLERVAKRACFIPIPRAVTRLAKLNAPSSVERGAKSNGSDNAAYRAANWLNESAVPGPAQESDSARRNTSRHSIMLVVDQRLAMRFGSRRKTKSVLAAEIAAFIAWRAVAQNASIGALVFNDKKIDFLWPACSRLSVMLILHSVLNRNHVLSEDTKAALDSEMLNRALLRVERFATHESTVFLISDTSGFDEKTAQLLTKISQHSRLHLVLVYDPRQQKFSKTRWFFGNRLVWNPRDRVGLSAQSGIQVREAASAAIPTIRFSTWDNAIVQLSRASKESILPPQVRPAGEGGNGSAQPYQLLVNSDECHM